MNSGGRVRAPVSVCVLACDEERELERCLESVAWADEIVVVVDAKSRDGSEAVARRLGPLLPRFVFVGGCATGLLITDPASAPVRVTKDVDVIAELASYGEYSTLGERLRGLGFREDDSEGAPVCRVPDQAPGPRAGAREAR